MIHELPGKNNSFSVTNFALAYLPVGFGSVLVNQSPQLLFLVVGSSFQLIIDQLFAKLLESVFG